MRADVLEYHAQVALARDRRRVAELLSVRRFRSWLGAYRGSPFGGDFSGCRVLENYLRCAGVLDPVVVPGPVGQGMVTWGARSEEEVVLLPEWVHCFLWCCERVCSYPVRMAHLVAALDLAVCLLRRVSFPCVRSEVPWRTGLCWR